MNTPAGREPQRPQGATPGPAKAGGEDVRSIENTQERITLVVTGSLEAVPKARHLLARWLARRGAAGAAVEAIELVVTEVCNNAIEHGCASRTDPLSVCAQIHGEDVSIDVLESNGSLAAPLSKALDTAEEPPEAIAERGRGLFLIRAYVDEVRIDETSEGRLRIHLRKRIRA